MYDYYVGWAAEYPELEEEQHCLERAAKQGCHGCSRTYEGEQMSECYGDGRYGYWDIELILNPEVKDEDIVSETRACCSGCNQLYPQKCDAKYVRASQMQNGCKGMGHPGNGSWGSWPIFQRDPTEAERDFLMRAKEERPAAAQRRDEEEVAEKAEKAAKAAKAAREAAAERKRLCNAADAVASAVDEKRKGNVGLSQNYFFKALSFGASTSDSFSMGEVQQWLFYSSVHSEVSAALASDDLFAVEAGVLLAARSKYPDASTDAAHSTSMVRLISRRQPLLKRFVSDLLCAPDGGGMDPASAAVFSARLDALGVESPGDLSLLVEGDFPGFPPIRVRKVLPILLRVGERAVSTSETAYSNFMASCPVTAEITKSMWAEDLYTGTVENGLPLRGPSNVDMWSDLNPPSEVSRPEWEAVRDGLHSKGKSLGGKIGSVGSLVYRSSLALNLMQHRYKTDLFVIGGQGRLFVERAAAVLIPPAAMAAAEAEAKRAKPDHKGLQISQILKVMKDGKHAAKEVVDACYTLLNYGNRTDHDSMPDLKPDEKPLVIKNVVVVAKALLAKVS